MTSYLIREATIGAGDRADIHVSGGVIAEVGVGLSANGATVIDADGLVALPGLVDLHTHLRQPGYEASETVLSGSQAAAAGGFTAVHAMANTFPVADSAGVVDEIYHLGRSAGYVEVRPVGAVTAGLEGTRLAELGAMARSEAAVRVFSDDGKCVSDPLIMRRALEYVRGFDGVIAQHAQDPRLTEGAQANEGAVASELGLTGWPSVAEEAIIARDILLAEHVGSRLHICHLSTAGSVELVRWAKKRGIRVTAEATPHHLLLTDENLRSYDARFKVNPPLRTSEDVQAVREGVADGTIDIIATDHAPHPIESKDCEWAAAAFGMVGLESALSVVQESLVNTGMIDWDDVARILSVTPASIGRVAGQGHSLATGAPGNITLIDPAAASVFTTDRLAGKSGNSPYIGLTLPGRVEWTFFRGRATVSSGTLVPVDEVAA